MLHRDDNLIVDNSRGDRWFCSEQEAKLAGFRKSEDCPSR